MRGEGRGSRRGAGLALAVWLGLALVLSLPTPVLADDCSGPSDCQAPPGNADAATGLAAAMAVLAIVLATATRRREQRRIQADREADGEGRPATTPDSTRSATSEGGQVGASFDRSSEVGSGHERRAGAGFAPASLDRWEAGDQPPAGQPPSSQWGAAESRDQPRTTPPAQTPDQQRTLPGSPPTDEPPTRDSGPGSRLGGARGGEGLGRPAAGEGWRAGEGASFPEREGLAGPNAGPSDPGPEDERPTGAWRVPPELSGDPGGSRAGPGLARPEGGGEAVLHERRETVEWQADDEGSGRERQADRGPAARPPASAPAPEDQPNSGPSRSGELGGAHGGHGLGRAPAESPADAEREPSSGPRDDPDGQPPPGRDRAARRPEDDPGRGRGQR